MKKWNLFLVIALLLFSFGCTPFTIERNYSINQGMNNDVSGNAAEKPGLVYNYLYVGVEADVAGSYDAKQRASFDPDVALAQQGASLATAAQGAMQEIGEIFAEWQDKRKNESETSTTTPLPNSDSNPVQPPIANPGPVVDPVKPPVINPIPPVTNKVTAYDYKGLTNNGRPTWYFKGQVKSGQTIFVKAGSFEKEVLITTENRYPKKAQSGNTSFIIKNADAPERKGNIAVLIPPHYAGQSYKASDAYLIFRNTGYSSPPKTSKHYDHYNPKAFGINSAIVLCKGEVASSCYAGSKRMKQHGPTFADKDRQVLKIDKPGFSGTITCTIKGQKYIYQVHNKSMNYGECYGKG